ncbi:MAG: NOG1 family protein [Promethearchaeota archaeon]
MLTVPNNVPDSQSLLDMAFRKASKAPSIKFKPNTPSYIKARKREIRRIKIINNFLINKLEKIVKSFPSIENLHPFYNELIDILVDKDILRNYLGSINGVIRIIDKLTRNLIEKIRRSRIPDAIARYRLQFYGRISSIIKTIDEKLSYLDKARFMLKKLPSFNIDNPIFVIAGYPNVGKSSLIRLISTAKPRIDYYPFTTKHLVVGHRYINGKKVQLIDTPGLLDRPLEEKNQIELQAIIALKYLADKIIYIFDASGNSGYDIEKQVKLFNEINKLFSNTPIITCLNKIDLKFFYIINEDQFPRIQFKISTVTKEGIEDLIQFLFKDIAV